MAGAPSYFETVEDLDAKINEYFNGNGMRKKTITLKDGETVDIPVPTISGLAYFLGFESRQSFYDYEKRDGFSYTIKRARLFIETEYEMQLSVGNTTGAIFALKNMGWKDKTETDITTNGQSMNPLSPQEAAQRLKELDI